MPDDSTHTEDDAILSREVTFRTEVWSDYHSKWTSDACSTFLREADATKHARLINANSTYRCRVVHETRVVHLLRTVVFEPEKP